MGVGELAHCGEFGIGAARGGERFGALLPLPHLEGFERGRQRAEGVTLEPEACDREFFHCGLVRVCRVFGTSGTPVIARHRPLR